MTSEIKSIYNKLLEIYSQKLPIWVINSLKLLKYYPKTRMTSITTHDRSQTFILLSEQPSNKE